MGFDPNSFNIIMFIYSLLFPCRARTDAWCDSPAPPWPLPQEEQTLQLLQQVLGDLAQESNGMQSESNGSNF